MSNIKPILERVEHKDDLDRMWADEAKTLAACVRDLAEVLREIETFPNEDDDRADAFRFDATQTIARRVLAKYGLEGSEG